MRFVDTPPLPDARTTGHGEWIERHRARSMPTLPVLGVAFAAGILLSTRSGRGLVSGVVRTTLRLARPTLIAGGLCKLGELSTHSRTRPPTSATIT